MPHEFYDGIFAEDRRIRGSLRRFARRFVQINIAELLVVARSQEESIVSRFEADVLSVVADTLTQAGTAARWERHGIGAQELAMHLLDISAAVKSATRNLSDYKRRMALAIRIIVMGANGEEI